MDIDLKTALSERLSRIRALHHAIMGADHDHSELLEKDIAHLQQMLDTEISGAIGDLEAANG